jgi:hypothetical protein
MAKAEKNTPPTQHLIQTEMFIEGKSNPGDDKKQADTRAFLHQLMRNHPNGTRTTKLEYRDECMERFKISGRDFDRLWLDEVANTGAIAFRKRGPRGPRSCE